MASPICRRFSMALLVSVVLLFTLAAAARLNVATQSILDFLEQKGKQLIQKEGGEAAIEQMRKLLDSAEITPDCKSIVQQCINEKAQGNCLDDVKDCAKDVIFGPSAGPKYSNMGPDIDLPGIMQEVAAEISLSDGTAVAKQILKECVDYQKSSWLTAFEGLLKKKDEKLLPQAEFLCRALTGRDVGEFRDGLTAPLTCKAFDDQRASCVATIGKAPLTQIFKEYFPIVAKSYGSSVTPEGTVDFRGCWNTQKDRTVCIISLFIGRICAPACPIAECTYKQLNQTAECSEKLRPQSPTFFTVAASQCNDLARAIQITGIPPCKNIDPPAIAPQSMSKPGSAMGTRSSMRIALMTTVIFHSIWRW